MINADKILLDIIVTEKATVASSNENKYTFRVHKDTNRVAVQHAVEKTFDVKVTAVNIQNVKPKAKPDRTRRGAVGFKPGYKKAIVTLAEGDKIELV